MLREISRVPPLLTAPTAFAAPLTGNVTTTITAGISHGDQLTLILTQDGTGSRTMTWQSNFKKAGGTLPLTTTGGQPTSSRAFGRDELGGGQSRAECELTSSQSVHLIP